MTQNALFVDALNAENIPLPMEIVTHDKFTRWGKHDCYWAKAVSNGFIYGDFSRAISKVIFPSFEKRLSAAFIEIRQKALEQQRMQAAVEQEKYWLLCATRAENIWNKAINVVEHPYLTRKKVGANGLKVSVSGSLIIPLSDVNGKIWTLQFITQAGKKFYMKSGLKKGRFFMFGNPVKRIFFCEGYATAATVFDAVKDCCVACMDAKNIIEVAAELKIKYPSVEFVFCADDDKYASYNTGLFNATSAAFKFKGRVVHPFFKAEDSSLLPTDFNDAACLYGIEHVRHQIFDIWGIKP